MTSPPRASDIGAAPEGAGSDLREARARAVAALLEAEEVEARARKARRKATRLLRHYEGMLMEQANHTIEEI